MANKTIKEKHKPNRKTLRDNEYYNPKTKRYEYHYVDSLGKKRVVSSYRLTETDIPPKGKRTGKSLREKEIEIDKILSNGVDVSKLTLLDVINKYLKLLYSRKNLSYHTKTGYNVTINSLKEYPLGHMQIQSIRMEHCEDWLTAVRKRYRGSSIQTQISLINRAFEYAVDHDYILKNPFRRIKSDRSDSKDMTALTPDEMNSFLNFCKNDSRCTHCYEMIYILFWTGLRVSELCGLTVDDLDFNKRIIRVNKQLQCIKGAHVITTPKTLKGVRYIPMTDGVYECFQSVLSKRYLKENVDPVCYDNYGNSYSGFIFLATRSRKTIVRGHVEEYLRNCIIRYNSANPDKPLRKFEPHICRHTFATNMQSLPLKTLQSILGHSNVSTTMNHYVDPGVISQQCLELNNLAREFY